jgi:NADPH:quinone reductase-like Zn-dependent oxidoreductase
MATGAIKSTVFNILLACNVQFLSVRSLTVHSHKKFGGPMKAEGWFIYRATDEELKERIPAKLIKETFELSPPEDNEVIAAPLFGCWEGNMGHSIKRRPIDICRFRNEEKVIIGNAGVVEIVDVGKSVKTVRPGQKAVIFCIGDEDRFGFPKTIMGYDAAGTMGCLATLMKGTDRQFIPIPEHTQYSLSKWAGFSLRYITAWSNWEMAHGTYRLSVTAHELAAINVWGWGGGVTIAELDLARRFGARSVMLSGSDERLHLIRQMGIRPLDRRKYGNLNYNHERYKSDPDYAREHRQAEEAFLADVTEMTHGRKVQIFIDMIGTPVFRTTLKALAREGVITTAGWREGMELNMMRAIECIERHQHIHTHYARFTQGWQAVAFADGNNWLPPKPDKIYSFDEIPTLSEDYSQEKTEYFPIFSINR